MNIAASEHIFNKIPNRFLSMPNTAGPSLVRKLGELLTVTGRFMVGDGVAFL